MKFVRAGVDPSLEVLAMIEDRGALRQSCQTDRELAGPAVDSVIERGTGYIEQDGVGTKTGDQGGFVREGEDPTEYIWMSDRWKRGVGSVVLHESGALSVRIGGEVKAEALTCMVVAWE